jgi:hypothetical protein
MLAATTLVVAGALAAELTLPGEPELHAMDGCAHALPPDQPLAHGRVVSIEPRAHRITLEFLPILPFLPEGGRHVFRVDDVPALEGLGPGDKVRFEIERDGQGYSIGRLEHSN